MKLPNTFELFKTTKFEDFEKEGIHALPESDLLLENGGFIYQFKFKKADEANIIVEPGIYNLVQTSGGVQPKKTELKKKELLTSISSTARILLEATTFFKKLDVYEKLGLPKKRGVLLYSDPGMGKSSATVAFSLNAIQEDPGTVVFNWPTSDIDADDMLKFMTFISKFSETCTRLILIVEDIGGGESASEHGPRDVNSGLLNLLDGVGLVFKLPTFIVATTNYPQSLLSSLANRPGRFDLMVKLEAPTAEERVALVEFIAKRELTDAEKDALFADSAKDLSIAHLEEVVVRSLLHEKTIPQVLKELHEHKEKFNAAFQKPKNAMGFGGGDDD